MALTSACVGLCKLDSANGFCVGSSFKRQGLPKQALTKSN